MSGSVLAFVLVASYPILAYVLFELAILAVMISDSKKTNTDLWKLWEDLIQDECWKEVKFFSPERHFVILRSISMISKAMSKKTSKEEVK